MLLVRLIYNKTGTKRLSCSNNNPCRRGARSGARVAKLEYENSRMPFRASLRFYASPGAPKLVKAKAHEELPAQFAIEAIKSLQYWSL
jgi:hypothetical protein